MVSSGADDTIVAYNCMDASVTKTIPVRKYGVGVLRYLQGALAPTVVTASTTGDHHVRALDMGSCNYIRYYVGHDSQVVSISTSPVGPGFLSSSQDAYVRMWDCRKPVAVGKVRALGTPLVAYDPKGLIFGIAYNASGLTSMVKLYDARNWHEGPFLEFSLENPSDAVPTCFKFSSDGEYFMVVNADVSASVTMYDAYEGKPVRSFTGHRNASGMPLEASFSPNSAFIASGSDDGSIVIWDAKSGDMLFDKQCVHAMPSACVLWNPTYAVLASACQNVLLWLPEMDGPAGRTDGDNNTGTATF